MIDAPIHIRPVEIEEAEAVQEVFNHREIIGWLGGFTMLENVKNQVKMRAKVGMFGAWDGDVCVGGIMIAARPMSHNMKYGSVGVLPEYRRRRISTALYAAVTMQGILEGRRLFEDSIVANNPVQFKALPTMGVKLVGTLRARTASGLGLALFDHSLVDRDFDLMHSRIKDSEVHIHLRSSYYTKELREKNRELYEKKLSHFIPLFNSYYDLVSRYFVEQRMVTVVEDTSEHPTDARRKQFAARGFFPQEQDTQE